MLLKLTTAISLILPMTCIAGTAQPNPSLLGNHRKSQTIEVQVPVQKESFLGKNYAEPLRKQLEEKKQICTKQEQDFLKTRHQVPDAPKNKKDTLFITKKVFDEIYGQFIHQNKTKHDEVVALIDKMSGSAKIDRNLAHKIKENTDLYASNCNRVVRDTSAQIERQSKK